jgi:repressor LexA
MQEISKKIGQRIKEAREEKGLTQKELGEYLGYSAMGISYFEQGVREIKLSDLERLAQFFGRSLSYFLSPGLTIFRADKDSGSDDAAEKSLSDFEAFLASRNKKK